MSDPVVDKCMLCGSLIGLVDGVWWLLIQLDSADPWWFDHCTGHDLRGLVMQDPDLRHCPRVDTSDTQALEDWLDTPLRG